MLRSILRRGHAATLLISGIILAASTTVAAAVPHVRGEVIAITGDVATVKTTSGQTVEVTMKPDFGMSVYRKIAIEDLKPDDYLSIPSITAADGTKQAVAISVFPAAMHGVGEGESPWDLGEGSKMTNAAFATMESQGADHSIVVSYAGTQETVSVPEGTPIMAFGPAPDRKLAVGDHVIFFATDVDGKLTSGRAGIMEDGSLPPV
jgi:hypothetical protein